MDAKIEAQRWPHTCKVYYMDDVSSYDDGTERVLYEGKCYVYESTNMRIYKTDGVIKNDRGVDIPALVKGISGGCMIDIVDDNESITGGEVATGAPVRFGNYVGTTIYFNYPKN